MRALLILRPDGSARYGGDTKLVYDTCEALRGIGVDADVVESSNPDARGYDIAHIFNVGDPGVCELQVEAVAASGVPIVLSPVWLDLREFTGRAFAQERAIVQGTDARKVARRLDKMKRLPAERFLSWRDRIRLERREQRQAKLCGRARVLLPNSAIEARDCLVRLGVRHVPMVMVPILGTLDAAGMWQTQRHGVVAVGRVETRKNQTGLAFALRDSDIPVDVIGENFDPNLVAACQRWCRQARFHGRVPRADLLAALGRAAVHVLVSWTETAGIASLEAAAAGAHLVVSDRGAEFEYFGDDAEYADPADPESIRAAIERALARPPRKSGDSLDQRVRRFSWEYAARETLRAYQIAV